MFRYNINIRYLSKISQKTDIGFYWPTSKMSNYFILILITKRSNNKTKTCWLTLTFRKLFCSFLMRQKGCPFTTKESILEHDTTSETLWYHVYDHHGNMVKVVWWSGDPLLLSDVEDLLWLTEPFLQKNPQ